jgi:hypothetical protein
MTWVKLWLFDKNNWPRQANIGEKSMDSNKND